MGGQQQAVVVAIFPNQLQAHWQAALAAREGQVHTGQAQKRPAAAKDRVARAGEPQGCGTY